MVASEGAIAMFPAMLSKLFSLIVSTPTDGVVAALLAATARVVREQAKEYQGWPWEWDF